MPNDQQQQGESTPEPQPERSQLDEPGEDYGDARDTPSIDERDVEIGRAHV